MEFEIVKKSSFSVIGKEGSGPLENATNWIQPLWPALNREIAGLMPLVKQPPVAWGAMQNLKRDFSPWDSKGGLYLAGLEVENTAEAPENCTKWTIPAQTYAVVKTTLEAMPQVYSQMPDLLAAQGQMLCAAVQERYPNPQNPTQIELWFPIEPKK